MIWRNLASPLAIAPRRRVVAAALMYGLSLTVRFTSATGEETEVQAQAAESPMTSIMIKDGAQGFRRNWNFSFVEPIAFHRRSLSFQKQPAACEPQ